MVLPWELRDDPLPPVVDNSLLPYLRPVFSQESASCGQACMVGYNFTYEMDRLRDLDADSLENQYATHFTYNFMNGGNGWFGVSYFHSMEVLRLCGNMNCVDYGGTYYDDGKRWIDGYEVYYHAMHNRINGAYSINTGTMDGLMTLKHWLFDHLEDSAFGGVASFYSNTPWNAKVLNDTTPEGGKHVITAWSPAATHAMTIVGYNDSIRWDYNLDGQYTNDMDINSDGILDARDWEVGGVKFVNSYGNVHDSGFCYMMYKVLAETFENGGIWNRSVHVLDVKENYAPLLTFKVSLKHNYREKIRIRAGVSADTASGMPEHIMDYPIFNFQGANHFMQGQDTAEYLQTIEFGLDVTPLYSYTIPGQPARYFLMIDENDPNNEGTGELIAFSLMDYSSTTIELISVDAPRPLLENNLTLASVAHNAVIGRPEIVTESLPPFVAGQPYSQTLTATGGSEPYTWDLEERYIAFSGMEPYVPFETTQVLPDPGHDTIVPVPLGFSFPFYGRSYDTVYVHIDGYLQFQPDQLPWPYMADHLLLLKSNPMIAPLTHKHFDIQLEDDGAWFDGDSSRASFRWNLSFHSNPLSTDYDFSVTLHPSGRIEFHYGSVSPGVFNWISGISAGDKKDFVLNPIKQLGNFLPDLAVDYKNCPVPEGMDLSADGNFSGTPSQSGYIYDLEFGVTDNNNIQTTRLLQFSTGPGMEFIFHGGEDEFLDYGDTVWIDALVYHHGNDVLTDAEIHLTLEDPFTELLQYESYLGEILPGDTLKALSCLAFILDESIPDQHTLWLGLSLNTGQGDWVKDVPKPVNAPKLKVFDLEVVDGNNGLLEAGETAQIVITMINEGHSGMTAVTGELYIIDPVIEFLTGDQMDFGDLSKGHTAADTLMVHALDSTLSGYEAIIGLIATCEEGITLYDDLILQIGKKPVLVIDLDPHIHTGPVMFETFQELGIIADYYTYLPGNLEQYQSLFICLGPYNSNHELTWQEGNLLASYLDGGGRIYMEGRRTWRDDMGTPVHDRFNILPAGSPIYLEYLGGVDSTFMEGILVNNGAVQPFNTYRIEPIAPAFTILRDTSNLSSCAVAYDQGTYRTIGTIFELGSLIDADPPSTREGMLLRFLDFFGIDYSLTGIEDPPALTQALPVTAYPNPSAGNITFRFEMTSQGTVHLEIYDLQGRKVRTLAQHRRFSRGMQELNWDGADDGGQRLCGGIYFYQMVAGGRIASGKMIIW